MPIERFVWTLHALERLSQRGLTRETVERALAERHPIREANEGEADWRVETGRFVVLYNHPHAEDIDAIQIVTVWLRRRRPRRHLKSIGDEADSYPER